METSKHFPMMLVGELWEGLTPAEREQAAKCCPERRFPRGGTIFAPGDPPDALYVLTSGLVTLCHVAEDGQESILRVFGPGDVFGEIFLVVRTRPFLARALTPCTVTAIPGEGFLHLLSAIPRIGLNFIRVLSRHLADIALDRGQSSHKWSFDRLVLTLLKLSATHGVADCDRATIALPLTHQILADMIGASRETVSRHLGRLKRRGVVLQQGRTLVVRRAELQALAPAWTPSRT